MTLNVLLVNPPTQHLVQSEVPRAVREEGGHIPPLGLLYLHSYLAAHSDHRTELWDAALHNPSDEEIRGKISAVQPDVVGITATTHALVDAVRVAAAAKAVSSSIQTVIGGPHVSVFPRETIRLPGIDWAVCGEGEKAFFELLRHLESPGGPLPERGILGSADPARFTGPAEPEAELDHLPFPVRTALPYQEYRNVMAAGAVVATMVTSRGCPFQCAFCSTPHQACRMRSPANIADEVEEILALGIRDIDIMDDTFNLSPRRVMGFCEEIHKRNLRFRWHVRARIRGTTPEMLEAMRKAGCQRIQFGVESGTDEGMRRLNKGLTVRETVEVFHLARRIGIQTVAYFMLGCPHEKTADDVRQTIEFAINLDPDFTMFNVFTPYPGTALYEEALNKKLLTGSEWAHFAQSPAPGFRPRAWTEHLSEKELYELLEEAYRRFYWRPAVVLRNLRAMGGWRGLRHKARAAVKMLPGLGGALK